MEPWIGWTLGAALAVAIIVIAVLFFKNIKKDIALDDKQQAYTSLHMRRAELIEEKTRLEEELRQERIALKNLKEAEKDLSQQLDVLKRALLEVVMTAPNHLCPPKDITCLSAIRDNVTHNYSALYSDLLHKWQDLAPEQRQYSAERVRTVDLVEWAETLKKSIEFSLPQIWVELKVRQINSRRYAKTLAMLLRKVPSASKMINEAMDQPTPESKIQKTYAARRLIDNCLLEIVLNSQVLADGSGWLSPETLGGLLRVAADRSALADSFAKCEHTASLKDKLSDPHRHAMNDYVYGRRS